MSTEVQKWPEKKESQVPSREALEKSVKTSQKKPQEVAKAIKKDPQLWILSGMWKGVKEWASSSWDGTKAVFTGTGEFIGVSCEACSWGLRFFHAICRWKNKSCTRCSQYRRWSNRYNSLWSGKWRSICYTMSNRLLERERCRIRETPSN